MVSAVGTLRKTLWIGLGILFFVIFVVALWPKPVDRGHPTFFSDRSYDFEAKRVLDDVAVAGGDTGEALQAIAEVSAGDALGWYRAWQAAGDRAVSLASNSQAPLERGNALLRAHTYFRTAEFFLSPHDLRRLELWKKNVDAFYRGLDVLGVPYERMTIPYGDHHLNAVYYPGPAGAERRPLLVAVNGYDGTMEELYLSVVAAAVRHGYSVLTYEGPGQGSVIREQGLIFESNWEKPNAAVLDAFLSSHGKPVKIVLLGESLGGYLAPRAAAFDSRIDGVVAFDVWYDGYAIATRHVPAFAFWLRQHGYTKLLNFLSSRQNDPGSTWAIQNGEWVFGVNDPFAVMDAFKPYNLENVAPRIQGDVLLLAGADDHFVPGDQLDLMRKSLTHAHSVKAIMFDRASGGSLHCQIGAPSLWHAALFDWLSATYP
jgi:alpha-beta hydrolase superfamily lysophospholipase